MYFDKLVGLNPTSTAAKLNLASAAARTGDLKKAIMAWRDVLKVEPNRLDIRLDMANAQWEARDIEGAKANYQQILTIDKNNTEALNGIGLYHLRASKFAPAEAAFRSSIASNRKFIPAYNNLAVTLERMNRRQQAMDILEQALKIDPADPEIKKNLSRMKAAG
jgi:Tfp pilus assembly protein PilF